MCLIGKHFFILFVIKYPGRSIYACIRKPYAGVSRFDVFIIYDLHPYICLYKGMITDFNNIAVWYFSNSIFENMTNS